MKILYAIIMLTCLQFANAQLISQDFEGASGATDASLNWVQNSMNTPGYGWFYDTAPDFIVNGTRSAVCYGSNNDWLISPGFTLMANEEVTISFNYKTNPNSPSETADVTVYVGTIGDETIGDTGTVMLQNAAINAPTNTNFSDSFNPSSEGTYYLAFHVKTDANESFSVDDVVISSSLSIDEFEAAKASIYPNPVKDKINVNGTTVKTLELYSVLGKKLHAVNDSSSMDVSTFESGLYLLKIISESGGTSTRKVLIN